MLISRSMDEAHLAIIAKINARAEADPVYAVALKKSRKYCKAHALKKKEGNVGSYRKVGGGNKVLYTSAKRVQGHVMERLAREGKHPGLGRRFKRKGLNTKAAAIAYIDVGD